MGAINAKHVLVGFGIAFVLDCANASCFAVDTALSTKIDTLVTKLGAPKFRDREQAAAALADLGEDAYEGLARHRDHADPEIRARINTLLKQLSSTLVRLDPKIEKTLESGYSDHQVKLTFDNRSKETIRIFWKNFDGERQPWRGPLKHGGQYVCDGTYESHVWIITDEKERALGVYVIGKKEARIVVRPRDFAARKKHLRY